MELSPSEIVSEYAGFVWRALVHLGVSDNQLKDVSQEVPGCDSKAPGLRGPIFGAHLAVRDLQESGRRRTAPGRAESGDAGRAAREYRHAGPRRGAVGQAGPRAARARARHLGRRTTARVHSFRNRAIEHGRDRRRATGAPLRTCYSRLQVARDRVRTELKREEHLPRRKEGSS